MDTIERKYTAKEAMQSVVEYLKDDTVRATQIISIRTISESERKLFVKMTNHWLHKNRKRVFLLTDSVPSLDLLVQRIAAKYNGIRIVETATLEEQGMSTDKILNQINGAEADCVIVSLSKEVEENFIEQNRRSLNARVWLGLGCKRDWKNEKTFLVKVKELFSEATQKNNK